MSAPSHEVGGVGQMLMAIAMGIGALIATLPSDRRGMARDLLGRFQALEAAHGRGLTAETLDKMIGAIDHAPGSA